jgi:peptidoglycan/xylan/chitin deacetylase (PgdA/CDA1 family)
MTVPRFRVALTFDAEHADRPYRGPDATVRVLDQLAAADVTATFFVQGRWVEAEPRIARRIAADGHLIGNHSFYHARMPLLRPAALTTDVRSAERAIRRFVGVDPRPWFRCPFGAGMDDPAIVGQLARLGYRSIGWDVDGSDWSISISGAEVARRIIGGSMSHGDGVVVLLHPWTNATGRALPAIIGGLRAEGATFVRIDELDESVAA